MNVSRRSVSVRKFFLHTLLPVVVLCWAANAQATEEPSHRAATARIANPAAVYCGQKSGELRAVRRILDGTDYGSYSACVFGDNRWCEQWAMFRGACPVGGLKITGYDSDAEIYCAVTGGHVDMASSSCSYANGADCGLLELYSGRCRQQTVATASGIRYRQYPAAGLAIAYLGPSTRIVQSSGGIASENDLARENDTPMTLTVDLTKLGDLPVSGPLGRNSRDAAIERAALETGSLGPMRMPAVNGSAKLVAVDGLRVKTFVTLTWFDVCSVAFERHARFYHAGFMVTLTLAAKPNRLIADNGGYFGRDRRNCGNRPVWQRSAKVSSADRFYADIIAGKVSRSALNWFHSFQATIGALAVRRRDGIN